MNKEQLFEQIKRKRSFLCIGLDTDINKMPVGVLTSLLGENDATYPLPSAQDAYKEEIIFAFNKAIIDATHEYAIAYKPNLAFYLVHGSAGFRAFERTVNYIDSVDKDLFIIADAKVGDIGNTSEMYAKAYLQNLPCDAVTVAPYMGKDSVGPFLKFDGKWAIVLALTSNEGSKDFQMLNITEHDRYLYEEVIGKLRLWGTPENTMCVVGATKAVMLRDVRKLIPDHFLLVPGVGAQGGDLKAVAHYGMNSQCGLIVNASRSIIYASNGDDFAQAAADEAEHMQEEMDILLAARGIK